MPPIRCALLLLLAAASCQTYQPDPVDLSAHARAFAARMPDVAAVRAFAAHLTSNDAVAAGFDVADGLSIGEARLVALLYNPSLGVIRQQARIAAATAEFAGRWEDPQFGASFARIVANLGAHQWIVAGNLAQTLPITGRPGLERAVAESQAATAMLEVRSAEADVLDELDAVWVRYSVACARVELLRALVARLSELDDVAGRLADSQALNRLEARVFTLAKVRHQVDLAAAEGEVRAAALRLHELLGMPPGLELPFVAELVVPDRAPVAAATALPEHSRLVDIARCEHEVTERELRLAIRKQWPQLWLQPGWQEEDGQPRVGLGFSLPLPLWNRNAQEIAEKRAARAAAAAAAEAQLERATHSLALADAASLAAAAQRRLLDEELLPLAERQVADARRLAELGQLDVLLILDAVTRAYEAQLAAIHVAESQADAAITRNSLFWPSLAMPAPENHQ